MDKTYLPFEKKIGELDGLIAKIRKGDVGVLERERVAEIRRVYNNLSAEQTVQVSRHPDRPHFSDYLREMIKDYRPIEGDRCYGKGNTIWGGFGQIGRNRVLVLGQERGRDTKEKIACNFGSPMPEDYRKAYRLMKLAEKYSLPVVTFIDTPGAYPGVDAEERGQGQAIAMNLFMMPMLRVPIVSLIIGEGMSGGALGIGVANDLSIMKYATYSVISPEGGAGILWRDGTRTAEAAEALKLTAKDVYGLGAVESIVEEPFGGAHRNWHDTFGFVENHLVDKLKKFKCFSPDGLVKQRYEMIDMRSGGGKYFKKTKG